MPHPRFDALGELLYLLGLLNRGDRQHLIVVLLKLGLQLLRDLQNLSHVVQRLLMIRFENLITLRFSVREADIRRLGTGG